MRYKNPWISIWGPFWQMRNWSIIGNEIIGEDKKRDISEQI